MNFYKYILRNIGGIISSYKTNFTCYSNDEVTIFNDEKCDFKNE